MDAKTLIEIINIVEKNNPMKWIISSASKNEIYFEITKEQVPMDSQDGMRLIELGCTFEEEYNCWALYV